MRDVAALHVAATTDPVAPGRRFVAAGGFLWTTEIAALLRDAVPERSDRAPSRTVPDVLVRAAALFRPEMRQLVPDLGRRRRWSSARAETDLGWEHRPAARSVLDCARSLVDAGLA